MEKKNVVKVVVGVLLLGLAVFFIKSVFSSGSEPVSVTSSAVLEQPVSVEAKLVNGIQEIGLSWGKFNYNPGTMIVKKDVPVKITADLDRLQGCFRSINIPDLGVSGSFSEQHPVVEFTPAKSGTFPFSCAMGMGSGTLIVK